MSATGGAGKEETAAAKAVATFLPLLAAKAPLLLITNLDPVNAHLLAEPQALRCGVVSTYGKLIQHKAEQGPAELQPTIDGLPAVPLARTADKNDVVRSRALHVLKDLAEAARTPSRRRTPRRPRRVSLRLSDKNANGSRDALEVAAVGGELDARDRADEQAGEPRGARTRQLPAAPEPAAEEKAAEPREGGAHRGQNPGEAPRS